MIWFPFDPEPQPRKKQALFWDLLDKRKAKRLERKPLSDHEKDNIEAHNQHQLQRREEMQADLRAEA